MVLAAKKQAKKFTYSDYLSWNDEERWEIINGEAYNMTPAPTRNHQSISVELLFQIKAQIIGKKCEVYHAPFDVRLPLRNEKEEEIENIVQPDISVIATRINWMKKGAWVHRT